MGLKKIATNLPEELLDEAVSATGLNQTQTIIEALKELIAREKRLDLLRLKGSLHIDIDLDKSRNRRRLK